MHRDFEDRPLRIRVTLLEVLAAILLLPFTLTFARVFASILGF
jgi:hypothetical protein